jgi:hypothetical protein
MRFSTVLPRFIYGMLVLFAVLLLVGIIAWIGLVVLTGPH